MASTLLDPKVKIYRWTFNEMDVLEFEKHLEKATDAIKGVAVSDTMRITWLPISDKGLLCIIEWCEWARENN